MKPLYLLGLCVLLLAGPALAEGAKDGVSQEARVKIAADVEKCHSRQFNSHRAAAQCINEAVQRVLISVDYPYMDLLQVVSAYRIACAQKMDSDELSESDCNQRMGELRKRVTAEEARRRNAADAPKGSGVHPAAGPKPTNMAVLLKGIAAWSLGIPEGADSPKQIVCFESGPMISCR